MKTTNNFILNWFNASDEDDTAELLKELQKIKRERAEEAVRKEQERKEEEERIRTENLMRGNPLLNQEKTTFKVKRRYTGTVFFFFTCHAIAFFIIIIYMYNYTCGSF